jgi:hypothetical protein
MDRTVNHLAGYGRHGDDTLLHVSRAELEGIRQLTGKDFTYNPHTGLPEAFNLSDVALPALSAAIAGARRLNRPSDNSYTYPDSDMAKTSSGQISGTAMPGEPGMFVGGGASPYATSATDADFANQSNSTGPAYAPNGMPLPPVPPSNPDEGPLTRNKFYESNPATIINKKEKGPQAPQGSPGLIRQISDLGTRLGKHASQFFNSPGSASEAATAAPEAAAAAPEAAAAFAPEAAAAAVPEVAAAASPEALAMLPLLLLSKGGIASMRGEEGMTANIMNEAKAALLNEHPRPREALERFENMFGRDALYMLRDKMTGGRITGAGGGMDDLIPGTIEGRQQVRLADGEFVVPADVVSGLGDGSTDHGVRRLHEMMNAVRKQRTGKKTQPKSIGGKITL